MGLIITAEALKDSIDINAITVKDWNSIDQKDREDLINYPHIQILYSQDETIPDSDDEIAKIIQKSTHIDFTYPVVELLPEHGKSMIEEDMDQLRLKLRDDNLEPIVIQADRSVYAEFDQKYFYTLLSAYSYYNKL